MKLGIAAALLAAVVGCNSSTSGPPRPARGTERGDCRPPIEKGGLGSCDVGLLCLSNLCVRPPPADCTAVAEKLASNELGNYAEPEARAPMVAKYKDACTKALVSKEQGECIAKATDTWSAKECAPAMFPDMKSSDTGDLCDRVTSKIRALVDKQLAGNTDPSTQQLVTAMTGVMKESCQQDGWPDALKQCLAQANDDAAMTTCNAQMPPAVQQKIADRMQKAMQANMQTMPPPPAPPSTAPSVP